MPRAPVPFCGCGGTPHGRGSFAERTVSGGRLSGRGKRGSKTSRCRNKGAFIYTMDGVRDLEECSGRVSEESAARTYWLSGRTWTRLALPVPVGPGRCWLFRFGAREGRVKGKRDGRSSLTAGRNGPGRKEKAGMPGFPRNGRERARKKRGKRESQGSLAMGGNGPRRKGESGKAGVPSQWEGTGQEEMEKARKPGFPRSGRERARKKWRKRESRGSLAMGGNGPGGESGLSVRSEAESESARRGPFIATVGMRAAGDSRLGRWGSSAQRGVRVLSAGRNMGSGADSVDAVRAVGSALIFCTGSEKEGIFPPPGAFLSNFVTTGCIKSLEKNSQTLQWNMRSFDKL
ncbi:hypothetical protein GEV33_010523 [Tenebrio molitor]|uniref:Uncharacterized protein n=1 Tax=Tenebrio molitor TaxID=7067 RepID=A0A8J6L8V2_TENMO|nr:hypothetical protein GEV33_010523 [Tenebrio molitor]